MKASRSIASEIVMDWGAKTLSIDGRPFPWHISEGGPIIWPYDQDTHLVWVPIITDSITERPTA